MGRSLHQPLARSCACLLLPYDTLRALTVAYTGTQLWMRPRPHVYPERRRMLDGSQCGNVVRFADPAPWCVIPHELAHLVHGPDHGIAWLRTYRQIGEHLQRAAPDLR